MELVQTDDSVSHEGSRQRWGCVASPASPQDRTGLGLDTPTPSCNSKANSKTHSKTHSKAYGETHAKTHS